MSQKSQFFDVMNELNALFNNNEENFDSLFEYCRDNWGSSMGRLYFEGWFAVRRGLPEEAKQEHEHIFKVIGSRKYCIDCDLWEDLPRKYDGKMIQTIQEHKKIKFDDFAKIYNKDAIEFQLRNLIQSGLVTLKDGWLEARS